METRQIESGETETRKAAVVVGMSGYRIFPDDASKKSTTPIANPGKQTPAEKSSRKFKRKRSFSIRTQFSRLVGTCLLTLTLLLSASELQAKMYVWTDENGVKHYSNSPPPQDQEASDLKTRRELDSETPADAARRESDKNREVKPGGIRDQIRKQNEKAAKKDDQGKKRRRRYTGEIVMFMTQWCGACKRARAFFKKNRIRYREYDIDASKEGLRKFKALNGRGVPLILIGDRKFIGFNEAAILNVLGMDT